MAGKKLTVVIAQQQGKNPVQRHLEEELAVALLGDAEVDISLVPHLYDLTQDHSGMLFLRSIPGDLIVLGWMFPRALRWVLDRNGVRGQAGTSLLEELPDDDEDLPEPPAPQGIGAVDVPKRKIYCIDLRVRKNPADFLVEIRRIARESTVQTVDLLGWIQGSPRAEQMQRYLDPVRILNSEAASSAQANGLAAENVVAETIRRRWYPVIDYSRCTNCMECIDFCLFGVYGVDGLDRILVEQQDNCKKGCPACSRVCPENAIIFPLHKSDAIAGAEGGEVAGLKIDLSKLFGAPTAVELAAQERDAELVADGRDAVGLTVGIPERRKGPTNAPRDALDDLMDGLDQLDL